MTVQGSSQLVDRAQPPGPLVFSVHRQQCSGGENKVQFLYSKKNKQVYCKLNDADSLLEVFFISKQASRVSASDFSSVLKTSWIKVHPRQTHLYSKWRIQCIIYRMSTN